MKVLRSHFPTSVLVIRLLIAFGVLGAGPVTPALAAGERAEISAAVKHDVSQPLRFIAPALRDAVHRVRPVLPLPLPAPPEQSDGALQVSAGPQVGTTDLLNFPGIGAGDYGYTVDSVPPDTNLSVGDTQVVQIVNTSLAVFDKHGTGGLLYGPVPNNTVWSGFGGGCELNNDGDPIVLYDKGARRWIVSQFSVSTKPYLQCVAVSTSSDATGSYNRYAFSYGNTDFPDYPKIGVWPDAYYVSYNIFTNGISFAGAKVCAWDRAAMLAGAAATQQCVQLSSAFGGLLPSDLDGATPPPAGSPNYFVNFGTNSLNVWKFHVDWATPANTTLTGPSNIPVAAFTPACNGGACIPQPATRGRLDSLADRLMYRLAYRNLGDHESLVVNHSVMVRAGLRRSVSGIRWYELRASGGGLNAFQQGTYAPDTNHRWMGSIAMDRVGNIAVGYSVSGSTTYPSIRYAGRVPSDPPGTLQTENSITAGGGSQTGGLSRWGDYSSMSIDPVDDCTFWYTTEYLKSSGSFNWSTTIASFRFPGCALVP